MAERPVKVMRRRRGGMRGGMSFFHEGIGFREIQMRLLGKALYPHNPHPARVQEHVVKEGVGVL